MKRSIILLSLLFFSFSASFAQLNGPISTSRSNIRTNRTDGDANARQTQGQSFGEKKGWDGTVKGSPLLCLCQKATEKYIDFGGQGALKIDESSEKISLVKSPIYGNENMKGLPVKGQIVKGGRNPGPNTRTIKIAEDNTFELPADWKSGNYKLSIIGYATNEIIIEIAIDDDGNAAIQNANINTTKSNTKD